MKHTETSFSVAVKAADCVATGFYSGRFPFMPGTAGTAAALLLTMLLHLWTPASSHSIIEYGLILVFGVGGWLSTNIVLQSGKYGEDAKDPQFVVVDEFAGFYVGVAGLGGDTAVLLLGFLVFRIFDVLKPPPLKHFEHLPAAWGVMADDLGAGLYTALVMWLLLPWLGYK